MQIQIQKLYKHSPNLVVPTSRSRGLLWEAVQLWKWNQMSVEVVIGGVVEPRLHTWASSGENFDCVLHQNKPDAFWETRPVDWWSFK